MPEDKRPKPSIDLSAGSARQAGPRIPLPGPDSGATGGAQAPRGPNPLEPGKKPNPNLAGYLLAGLAGGIVALLAGYLGLAAEKPSAGFSDSHAERRVKDLEDRTASIEGRLRNITAPVAAVQSASPGPEVVERTAFQAGHHGRNVARPRWLGSGLVPKTAGAGAASRKYRRKQGHRTGGESRAACSVGPTSLLR